MDKESLDFILELFKADTSQSTFSVFFYDDLGIDDIDLYTSKFDFKVFSDSLYLIDLDGEVHLQYLVNLKDIKFIQTT